MKQNKKFKYLKSFLKKQKDFLSILDLDNHIIKIEPKFFDEKCELIFSYSKYSQNNENISDAIYLTKTGYYVYLSRLIDYDETYDVKIIYDSKTKKSEVLLFIKTLLKNKKI